MNFPQQGYQPQQQYPQQGYPGQQQPQQQAPQGVTQSVDEFFAGGVGGGAPSADLGEIGSFVVGTIVDMQGRQRTTIGTNELRWNKDGSPQMQLEVTLDTQHRNWENVKKVPTFTDANGQQHPKQPQDDDGKRRIYLWYTLRQAFEEAMVAAGVQKPSKGDQVAVKVTEHMTNPMGGQPIKKYAVQIRPGSPAAGAFFDQGSQQQAPPQQGYQPQPSQLGGQPNPAYAPPPQQQFPPQQAPARPQHNPAPQQSGFNPADAGPPPF